MRLTLLLSMFAALGIGGCAGANDLDSREDPPPTYHPVGPDGQTDPSQCLVLGVWIQDDPDLSVSLAIAGSDYWWEVGLCGMSAPRESAHIRIYGNPQPCPPGSYDESGMPTSWILAVAYGGQGTVVVNTTCLARPFGPGTSPDAEQFRVIIAHEVGHVLGVWEHVPRDCADPAGVPVHASGAPVCGPAVMNPYIDSSLAGLTGPDILQFDRRSVDTSVIPLASGDGSAGTEATCSLLTDIAPVE